MVAAQRLVGNDGAAMKGEELMARETLAYYQPGASSNYLRLRAPSAIVYVAVAAITCGILAIVGTILALWLSFAREERSLAEIKAILTARVLIGLGNVVIGSLYVVGGVGALRLTRWGRNRLIFAAVWSFLLWAAAVLLHYVWSAPLLQGMFRDHGLDRLGTVVIWIGAGSAVLLSFATLTVFYLRRNRITFEGVGATGAFAGGATPDSDEAVVAVGRPEPKAAVWLVRLIAIVAATMALAHLSWFVELLADRGSLSGVYWSVWEPFYFRNHENLARMSLALKILGDVLMLLLLAFSIGCLLLSWPWRNGLVMVAIGLAVNSTLAWIVQLIVNNSRGVGPQSQSILSYCLSAAPALVSPLAFPVIMIVALTRRECVAAFAKRL